MIEIIVERWTAIGGNVDFRWSVWRDGRRVDMGGPFAGAAPAEEEAADYCRRILGAPADRITHL